MAKFLNTSATNYYLEELIKNSNQLLVIVSPFLKFNERIKELIEDRNRMKNVDIRIIYGKSELSPAETNWLSSLDMVRVSYCDNLHAKCYLNENAAIITSMNLYDFSQQNNNEMGVLVLRPTDKELFQETMTEAQRLIRISNPTKLSAEPQPATPLPQVEDTERRKSGETGPREKLTTSNLSKKLGITTEQLYKKLVEAGYLIPDTSTKNGYRITDQGKAIGGEYKPGFKSGDRFIPAHYKWPTDLKL